MRVEGDAVLRDCTQQFGDETITKDTDPEWFVAAWNGCESAIEYGVSQGLVQQHVQVVLERIQVTYVDTTEAALYCSAFMAVAKLFGFQSRVAIVHDGQWVIRTS